MINLSGLQSSGANDLQKFTRKLLEYDDQPA
jgi:hypothetical protein